MIDPVAAVVAQEMMQFAHGWRTSWADFDGRTLRLQLQGLYDWAFDPKGDFRLGSQFHFDQLMECSYSIDEAVAAVRESGGEPIPEMVDYARERERELAKKKSESK